ncbi:MAG: 3-deoxy-8-phosphooctulonate synthase [Verrucomicrobiia bacterium]
MPKNASSNRFLFIGGPCVIESEKLCFQVAEKLCEASCEVGFHFVFKASYDKANRTSHASFRGLGMKEGLAILEKVKSRFQIPILTDVHSVEEVKPASEVADILQIPAFLCRQTDLLVAAAQSGREVNVKKGQFLSPWDVKPILEKLRSAGAKKYFITERGTTFGYNNLVVDMRGLFWMKQLGASVIFDATHAVQRPGGLGRATGGDRELAPVLARAAMAVGIDGLFFEAHPQPEKALSDGPNQLLLKDVPKILRELAAIRKVVKEG